MRRQNKTITFSHYIQSALNQFLPQQYFFTIIPMTSIPLLNDPQDEIRESLSLEEIRIALHFLKTRFRGYTVKEIVQGLTEYIIQKQNSAIGLPISRASSSMAISRVQQGLYLSQRRVFNQEDIFAESEKKRLIGKLYCESGINYSLAHYFYPNLTPKDYKQMLQLIAAQALNSIQKYLMYECQIKVQQLSTLQKRSIRQRLVNIRDWMGKTHPDQLKTYLLFIQRDHLKQGIEMEYKQVIQLYKLIIQSVKGPEVNVHSNQHNNRGLRQQLRIANQSMEKTLTKQQQNTLILLFKQLCSIQKVTDAMCQKYGYNIKWSTHSVKNILKRIYKTSLKKLIQTANAYLKKPVNLFFGYGDDDVVTLLKCENSLQTKITLLDFYILNKTTQLKLKQFVRKVNYFYQKQSQCQINAFEAIPEECVQLPTLIIEDKPIEVVDLIDHQQRRQSKREQCKIQTEKNDNSMMKKKRHWMEIVQLDQSIQQEEIFIFPTTIDKNDKQANQNTDIEDQIPTRRRQREIFRPTKKIDQIKEKDTLRDKKDHKIDLNKAKVKEQQPIIEKQNTNEKSLIQNQKTSIPKRSTINSSFDSIESQPVRLSIYNKSDANKNRRFKQKLKRFSKKGIQQDDDKMELQN